MKLLPLSQKDKSRMLALLTDARIKETYMLPDFNKPEDAVPLFQRLLQFSQEPSHFVRGIFAESQLVGFLNDVEIHNDIIELGYVIHPDHWNKGYATAALGLALRQLLDGGFREIITGAFSENTASIRVMEKAGMVRMDKTDTIIYLGTTHTCVYFHITA